jgi:hypothetical protein
MVKATLASEALVEEAAKLSSEAGVKRGIRATEVSSDGISQYRIDIVAGFVNETGLDALQLIEIVPSGFAAGPGEIVSSTPFEVLQTEPLLVIRFNLSGLKAGEAKDIVYGLKAMVGKQKADSLATELTLQEFVAPPILLAGTTAVDASSFKQPGLSAEASTLIIAVIVIVVVFLLLLVSLREGWLGGGAMPAKRKRWAYHGE